MNIKDFAEKLIKAYDEALLNKLEIAPGKKH